MNIEYVWESSKTFCSELIDVHLHFSFVFKSLLYFTDPKKNMEIIYLNRKMESIPLKNVENLFNDLEAALTDIKAVLDPFALLPLADFYLHLNKK